MVCLSLSQRTVQHTHPPLGCGSAISGVGNPTLEIAGDVPCALDATETAELKLILFGVCLHLARGEFCSTESCTANVCQKEPVSV